MKLVVLFFLILGATCFAADEKKQNPNDEPPQKDYYHKDFDNMDESFDKKVNHDNQDDSSQELERRAKK
jgi:hypothetical protein